MVVATQQQTKRPKQETAPMVNVKFKLRSNKVYKGHERPVKYSNQSDFHK